MSKSNLVVITFRGNDLALIGASQEVESLFTHRKSDNITYFLPRDFLNIFNYLSMRNFDIQVDFNYNFTFSHPLNISKKYQLYDFQQEAISSWIENNKKGIILLPTGAGKTIISLEIISILNVTVLIVVPTLVLLEQWKTSICTYLGLKDSEIGEFGGGKQEIRDITIITYDSAHLYVKRLRSSFGLLILDEAHHLAGASYEIIADGYIAPYRIALTATLDQEEPAYDNLVSKGFDKIVYSLKPNQLQNLEVLTNYTIETIKVKIDSLEEYEQLIGVLQNYLKQFPYNPEISSFKQLIFRVNRDRRAQQALEAYQQAKMLSFSSDAKLLELERLLRIHRNDKIIIFSDMVAFCERIAKIFFIPCITHRTAKNERTWILDYFKRNNNSKIVVSKILDEGLDIPSAKIGIILVGSGKSRQFIQRLGRIVRQHPDKDQAILYEIISESTLEERLAEKRKKGT